mmetsp:Transcript_24420/g.36412  ORF Transcript_24420/g.36412 Transcript_24420/m.36412 type:complete len:137 (-) Transcript_24420:378-788(-)
MAANFGASMAAAVDAEVAKYRELQEELQKLRSDQQTLMGQQNENEMVKQELDLLDDSANVFKMVGPVLMKNDLEDAKQTVDKRLEFITGELKKTENSIEDKEKRSQEAAENVQKMQGAMQNAAAEAARQIAAQQQK